MKVVNKVWFSLENVWASGLSEGAVYFKPWLWEGMQSKVNNNGHSLGAPVNMMENRLIPIVMA